MKRMVFSICFMVVFNVYDAYCQTTRWTLEACIDQALKNNLTIKKSKLNNQILKENLNQSLGNRMPNLLASGSQNFNFGRSVDPASNQFVQNTIVSNTIGLNTSLVLFNGFQNTNLIHQNNLNIQASDYDLKKTCNDVVLSVMGYYLQILLYNEQQKVATLALNKQIEKSEKLLSIENITADQVYKLKAQAAADLQNIIGVTNNLNQAKLALCQQLQIEYNLNFSIDSLSNPSVENIMSDTLNPHLIYKKAESTLPQILSNDIRIKSSLLSIKSTKGAYLPRLTFYGNASSIYSDQNKERGLKIGNNTVTTGYLNNNPDQPVFNSYPSYAYNSIPINKQWQDNFYQSLGFQLSIPILNNSQTRTNLAKAKINAEVALINQQITKDQLLQDIEITVQNYKASIKRYEAAKLQHEARTISFGFDEKKYNAGYINIYNYLEEKNNLTRSEIEFSQSKYDLIFKKKILDFYEGNLGLK
jgi:outer membrane protein